MIVTTTGNIRSQERFWLAEIYPETNKQKSNLVSSKNHLLKQRSQCKKQNKPTTKKEQKEKKSELDVPGGKYTARTFHQDAELHSTGTSAFTGLGRRKEL